MKREYVRMKERHRERKTNTQTNKQRCVIPKRVHTSTLEGNMDHSPMLHLTK